MSYCKSPKERSNTQSHASNMRALLPKQCKQCAQPHAGRQWWSVHIASPQLALAFWLKHLAYGPLGPLGPKTQGGIGWVGGVVVYRVGVYIYIYRGRGAWLRFYVSIYPRPFHHAPLWACIHDRGMAVEVAVHAWHAWPCRGRGMAVAWPWQHGPM